MRNLIICTVATLAGCAAVPPPPPSVPVELTGSQIERVETAVRGALKDPDSARFGVLRGAGEPKGKGLVVCGLVNAKNSFGGYVGSRPFYVITSRERGDLPTKVRLPSTDGEALGVIDFQIKEMALRTAGRDQPLSKMSKRAKLGPRYRFIGGCVGKML
jgi:hypothetical protein